LFLLRFIFKNPAISAHFARSRQSPVHHTWIRQILARFTARVLLRPATTHNWTMMPQTSTQDQREPLQKLRELLLENLPRTNSRTRTMFKVDSKVGTDDYNYITLVFTFAL
jgi:hypothetical protein